MTLWLEKPFNIMKKMIHGMIGYPVLEKSKTTKNPRMGRTGKANPS